MSTKKEVRTDANDSPETSVVSIEAPQMAPNNADVFPDFAVDPAEMTRRTSMLKEYVREHMSEGEDYGIIPGGNKPTLFKPGAEKLNAVFGLSPLVEILNRIEDWDASFVAYEVKVILLNKRTQIVEAEGVGSCNSRERKYKNQDAANVANTILKMAKKRALIDATLSATRASGMFTQDLEDLDLNAQGDFNRPTRQNDAPQQRQNAPREVSAASAGDVLTDAQHRAILAIAGRVFGRHSREEDLDRMVNKPLDQLSKGEASGVIDQLRTMLGEDTNAPKGDGEVGFTRANRNGAAHSR
ncbi:hypothetical protein B1R32_101168 [Abditibacterium utsteinense]|uniref:Uncharacterized protein n=1 Tax=Abditibacterium utsteinense TaxID=1960156 RepID=A0A2S8SXB3_9BACT|nr:hypothetical protein [Abditibacterium utsteinense]PQV65426.1 hypothetical protein B1R32_101168 [Abditibacterium utsteinense]